ncbi:vWA domain-containing protein [Nonomuraea roseoviolacea]|uniref:Ca-activated chloride channel family protein n=1 Tax=Nonomuraea roseoviolacea subsp. carminata TaxID=160689 RepID=A0ABT1K6M3_9ACTN|nr:von Willebrand factor type A domain-containing protein [Nonomuraea roseoviolacea]MCP2349570.1 Ca-activated chloride channel family protein [Nonomuraea roseoviolacea subsp. carminata]
MKLRPWAAGAGLVALLALAACGGGPGGSTESSTERAAPARTEAGRPVPARTEAGRPVPAQPRATRQARPEAGRKTAADAEQDTGRDAAEARISTFALDVDTASYSYARRALGEGRWPEPARIRPEEFVNSFGQDYAEPAGDGFTVRIDGAHLPGSDTAVVRVGLRTRGSDAAARRPADLTFVVDVSGSMAETGRLDLVKESLHTLIDQLAPGDRVSVVAFSDTAETLVPMTPLTARPALHAAVDRLAVQGGTNLETGLVTGYRQASRAFRPAAVNRVVLLSDGLANQGVTAWQAILDRVKEYAGRQVTLLTVGVGRDYGDELMEQLADNGDGAAVYVSTREEAAKVFAERLPTTIELRARDAKAQVAFNPSVVESQQLLGYDNRVMAAEGFRDDARDGGEVGPGHAVTALYSVRLRPGATGQLAQATVRWQDPDTRAPAEASGSVDVDALAPSIWDKAPVRLQVDVVAAAFAVYMRDRQAFGMDLPVLGEHARRLAESAEDPMVSELARLIDRARAIG